MAEQETKLSEEVVTILSGWKEEATKRGKSLRLYCGVDIGGTNTRVALLNLDTSLKVSNGETYLQLVKFKCNYVSDLLLGLEFIGLQLQQLLGSIPVSACLDAAGPILNQGTEVTVTNYHISSQNLAKSQLPRSLFPENTIFINDLAATAEGIVALSKDGRLSEFFKPMWTPHLEDHTRIQMKPFNYVVMAMGTGLGACLLLFNGEKHTVLPCESGHTSITPLGPFDPAFVEERELLHFLSQKIYQGKLNPEWEDICSGRGLVSCYEFLSQNDSTSHKNATAFDVVQKALSEEPLASKAMLLHYSYLLRAASQQCVGLIANGVFLAGDNQAANDPFVSKHLEVFHKEFLNSSKKAWVEGVPVYRQTQSYNLNLLGCVYQALEAGK